jgi:hypothetical protein
MSLCKHYMTLEPPINEPMQILYDIGAPINMGMQAFFLKLMSK